MLPPPPPILPARRVVVVVVVCKKLLLSLLSFDQQQSFHRKHTNKETKNVLFCNIIVHTNERMHVQPMFVLFPLFLSSSCSFSASPFTQTRSISLFVLFSICPCPSPFFFLGPLLHSAASLAAEFLFFIGVPFFFVDGPAPRSWELEKLKGCVFVSVSKERKEKRAD